MIKQIAGTTLSRGTIAILGLLILMLNTRYLGAEKLGQLAIYIIAINFILHISELVGGAALVFAQKTSSVKSLLRTSYVWSAFVFVSSAPVLYYLLDSSTFEWMLISTSAFVQSLNHSHLHLLVGKEKIARYNSASLIQSVTLCALLVAIYFFSAQIKIIDFLYAYLFAQLALFVSSRLFLRPLLRNTQMDQSVEIVFKKLLTMGFVIQLANIFQFGVYRINYLILKSMTSLPVLGVFTLGNQLSEKALIPGNAISTVQYAKISNQEDIDVSAVMTLKLMAVNILVTAISIAALLLIPTSWITWFFSGEFEQAQSLFLYFSPGIIFMSISLIYSHFFAGLGKYHLNAITSFAGLAGTVMLSLALIPSYGMYGAAIATSLVFALQATVQLFLFKTQTTWSWKEVLQGHINGFRSIRIKTFMEGIK